MARENIPVGLFYATYPSDCTYKLNSSLKKTRELWEKLASERELVVTRHGKPSALMISVSPETVEESLREIRRALFSAAVSRVRKRAETEGIPDDEAIAAEIDQSRKERGLRRVCWHRRSDPKA